MTNPAMPARIKSKSLAWFKSASMASIPTLELPPYYWTGVCYRVGSAQVGHYRGGSNVVKVVVQEYRGGVEKTRQVQQ